MGDIRLEARGACKKFFRKGRESAQYFDAVSPTNLQLVAGEVVVLNGRSGSGKSTLLNMMAGLLEPSEGIVTLDGQNLYELDDASLSRLRNERIGVVPQGQTALHSLSVVQNVTLPYSMYRTSGRRSGRAQESADTQPQPAHRIDNRWDDSTREQANTLRQSTHCSDYLRDECARERIDRPPSTMPHTIDDCESRALKFLDNLGIRHLADSYPSELSGGELRRVCVARALMCAPGVLLADEPTGNLDDESARVVLEILRAAADNGAAVLIVTHEQMARAYADHILYMNAGIVSER